MVFDCRPQVLPGAMDLSGLELAEICSMTRASTATSPPPEREQSFGGGGGGDLLGSICPELGVTPLVDPGTDCEDELPTPADMPSVENQVMDSELQSVFIDVVQLPTMITPVSDVYRAWCAPEYVDAVIAPPAMLPVVTRAPAAATLAVSNVLSPIRSPAAVGIMSEIGTPPVTAVPEALLLCNTEMMSQTPPETSLLPQVYAPSPDVGLVASKVTPDIADGPREGPFDAHHDRQGSPASPRLQ